MAVSLRYFTEFGSFGSAIALLWHRFIICTNEVMFYAAFVGLFLCLYIKTTAQFFMKILPEIRKFSLHFGSSSASGSEFRNFLKDFFNFVGVCRAMVLSTLWTAASLRLMLPVISGSAPQVAISSSCHDTVAPSSVVERFLLQARQPRTRCQTISVIRCSANTLLGDR